MVGIKVLTTIFVSELLSCIVLTNDPGGLVPWMCRQVRVKPNPYRPCPNIHPDLPIHRHFRYPINIIYRFQLTLFAPKICQIRRLFLLCGSSGFALYISNGNKNSFWHHIRMFVQGRGNVSHYLVNLAPIASSNSMVGIPIALATSRSRRHPGSLFHPSRSAMRS